MKRPENLIRNSLILLLLIAAGVASRFVLIDLPNVKPIAAIVLFAAFWFRSYWVAGLSLAVVMLVSNSGLDACPWQVTSGVMGGLVVAVFLGRRFGSRFCDAQEVASRPTTAIAQLFGSAFVMSLAFFVISNLAVWSMGQWYPLTLGGLVHCFTAAIPFFKYTFCGDLCFTAAIFGIWYAVETSAQVCVAKVASSASSASSQ
jgi:hypothetical protein